jgi:hypothetical protein
MNPMFAFRRDGIDRIGMAEKLLCFVQSRRKNWGYIAWNQIAEGKDQAINSKDGEAKAECVDYKHLRSDSIRQVRMASWISGTEWGEDMSYRSYICASANLRDTDVNTYTVCIIVSLHPCGQVVGSWLKLFVCSCC